MDGGRGSRRAVSSTALIYCEGAHDLTFVRYLIGVYANAGKLKSKFRSKQGRGGSPDTLVVECLNTPGAFDRKLLKADKDRAIEEIQATEKLANKHGIVLVWSVPCLESLLLSIVDGKDYTRHSSANCKKAFEKEHVPANKRLDTRAYEKSFPIEMIEEARTRLPELDMLVEFITA